ncbi:hypothetical protein KAU18_04450 [Candidatus Bathyarchaeota archaeon]|nr:hypothetical protein [Candidatus Bathyarchaeota archaeon]
METKLKIPEESKDIKKFILAVRLQFDESSSINWDSLAVWSGNRIPQYLWSQWKTDLTKRGFSWQKFLRLMKYRTDDAILWAYDRISWPELVEKVIESIEGPLGKALAES